MPPAPDPLSSRELEVLGVMAAGRSNQAIADELVVTLDTVKKHVGHVLGKVGAGNRTEAVARARELSLTPDAASFHRRVPKIPPDVSTFG